MTNLLPPLVGLFLGLAIGIAMTWVYLNGKLLREQDRASSQIELGLAAAKGEVSILITRATTQDELIKRQDDIIKDMKNQKDLSDLELQRRMNAQVIAEQKNQQIPVLTEDLHESNKTITTLREELSTLKAEKAKVEVALTQERVSFADKIQSLEKSEQKLAEQQQNRIVDLSDELAKSKSETRLLRDELVKIKQEKAKLDETLEQERSKAAEKIEVIQQAEQKFSDAFKALASEALKSNNESFMDRAKAEFKVIHEQTTGELDKRRQSIDETLKPVKESLDKVDLKINELEKARAGAYGDLNSQLKSLALTHVELQKQTANLVNALGTPVVRGRWGEIQLKRVVELAGMINHCDFFEQQHKQTEEGAIRPDLIVKLPGNKNIVVDAKAVWTAFQQAIEEKDEAAYRSKMKEHSDQVRDQIKKLSNKNYAVQFDSKPEFVILFLPGEVFYSAALQHDPALLEVGVEQNVIIATPTTLIALLKAVAYGCKQEALEQNAKEIAGYGKELYERVSTFAGHLRKLGKNLDDAVNSYNSSIGSVESRVLVTARKFKELQAGTDKEIEELKPIKNPVKSLVQPELNSHDSESNLA